MRFDRENVENILVISIGVIVLLLLTACSSWTENLPDAPPEKTVTVSPNQFSHQVRFEAARANLTETETAGLDAFLGRMELGRGAVVYLAAAGEGPIARRRLAVVAAYLRHRGFDPKPPAGAFGIPDAEERAVRVVIRHYVVHLPPCPDWTKYPGSNFANTVHSNFGCATATNLGLMVHDPADIAHGAAPGPRDGEFAVGAIDRYRKGETKELRTDTKSDTSQPQQTTNVTVSGGGS